MDEPINAIEADVREERIYLGHNQHIDRSITVYRVAGKSGYFFVAGMAIDVDGSPNAYKSPKCSDATTPLDDLSSSTANSRMYIQGIKSADGNIGIGPHKGYYVSQTSLGFDNDKAWDCGRWVDGETIPYIILPDQYRDTALGDAAIVVHKPSGFYTHAIFADTNPRIGEASLKVAANLERTKLSARNGDDNANYIYLVFPGAFIDPEETQPHWPEVKIRAYAYKAFSNWGGWTELRKYFPSLPVNGTAA